MKSALHISIIFPSRGPLADVERLLYSAAKTAADPHQIEVVARCDHDDPALLARRDLVLRYGGRPIVGPRYNGYGSVGIFHEEAARITIGRWILILDDDAEFVKDGWDRALPDPAGRAELAHFGPSVPFWAVSRGWYERLDEHLYRLEAGPVDQWLADAAMEKLVPVHVLIHHGYLAHHYKSREAARLAADRDRGRPLGYSVKEPKMVLGSPLTLEELRGKLTGT